MTQPTQPMLSVHTGRPRPFLLVVHEGLTFAEALRKAGRSFTPAEERTYSVAFNGNPVGLLTERVPGPGTLTVSPNVAGG